MTKTNFQNRDGEFIEDLPHYQATRYLRVDALTNNRLPVLYQKKGDCCGCTACYAVCPKSGEDIEIQIHGMSLRTTGAITMLPDEEGFLYPVVDGSLCIGCKKCISVCAFKK